MLKPEALINTKAVTIVCVIFRKSSSYILISNLFGLSVYQKFIEMFKFVLMAQKEFFWT